jgi:hypothetical protein
LKKVGPTLLAGEAHFATQNNGRAKGEERSSALVNLLLMRSMLKALGAAFFMVYKRAGVVYH